MKISRYNKMNLRPNEDDYHVIMIFKRKKDNETFKKSTRVIFHDIRKINQIRQDVEMYETIAEMHTARIYVSVNPVNIKRARKDIIQRMLQTSWDTDGNKDDTNLIRQVVSSCMRCPIRENKKFLVDIDTEDMEIINKVINLVNQEYLLLKTKSGYHLITKPFDVRILENMKDVEIKKNGQTVIDYFKVQNEED